MIWLASQMWILLAVAFALGVGIGWWVWGSAPRRPDTVAEQSAAKVEIKPRTPLLYVKPEAGPKDDLTQIIGIDSLTEGRLNAIGVFYLRQIAEWGPARAVWVEKQLDAPGRVERENWVDQAATLLSVPAE